jgi:hypothetical protein
VQLVLLVALLLAGAILVLRACGGSRTLEPEGGPVGLVGDTTVNGRLSTVDSLLATHYSPLTIDY